MLSARNINADNHQQAQLLISYPGFEIDAVTPDVNDLQLAQIPLRPILVLVLELLVNGKTWGQA